MRKIEKPVVIETPDYLRGYRDGMRDRIARAHRASADGLMGALLAIALLAGVGYFGYNYATTGRLFPAGVEFVNPLQRSNWPQR